MRMLRWALTRSDRSSSPDGSVEAAGENAQRLLEALTLALNEHLLREHYLPYESAQQLALAVNDNGVAPRPPDALNAAWWLETDDYSTIDFEAYGSRSVFICFL